jgi:hypothetical protein
MWILCEFIYLDHFDLYWPWSFKNNFIFLSFRYKKTMHICHAFVPALTNVDDKWINIMMMITEVDHEDGYYTLIYLFIQRITAIIQHVMPTYLDILTTKTETTSLPRHPVRGDIVCLCQVVESRDIHLKYSGKMRMRTIADRIFKCCRNATSPNTPVGDNDRIPLVVWVAS